MVRSLTGPIPFSSPTPRLLQSTAPASFSELARPLPMSLPSALQHLGVLEHAGPVHTERRRHVRHCAIRPDTLSLAEQCLTARRTEWEQRLDRLGAYLRTLEGPET